MIKKLNVGKIDNRYNNIANATKNFFKRIYRKLKVLLKGKNEGHVLLYEDYVNEFFGKKKPQITEEQLAYAADRYTPAFNLMQPYQKNADESFVQLENRAYANARKKLTLPFIAEVAKWFLENNVPYLQLTYYVRDNDGNPLFVIGFLTFIKEDIVEMNSYEDIYPLYFGTVNSHPNFAEINLKVDKLIKKYKLQDEDNNTIQTFQKFLKEISNLFPGK